MIPGAIDLAGFTDVPVIPIPIKWTNVNAIPITNGAIAVFESSDVTLRYNPSIVLLDMTNRFYLNSANTNSTETLNGYQYLNSVTSRVESLSTTTVKFYKKDASQDYSYINGSSGTPVITLTH